MSERGRDPQIVATALLGDARMIEACASHDIQTVIRLMRSRGASLRGLASVTGMSPGRIYEYEVGDRQANGFEVFERISDGFRIPGRCPRLADRPWERAEVRRRPCQRRPVRRSLLDPLLRRSRAGRCAGGRLLELAQEHPDQPRYGRQAEALIERALKLRRPESRRSTSLDQAGLAQTHFIQRELEQAASAGHRAIDVAEQTQSDRVRLQLQDLYRSAVAHRREAAVRDLSDRLASVLCA